MLERIYIDNYRCFVNFECRLASQQLVLGPNGAGKTTLFDVLSLLRHFCTLGDTTSESFLGDTRTRWQDVSEQSFELDVIGNEGKYTLRLVVDSLGKPPRPRVVKEEVEFSGKPVFRFLDGTVHLYNDRHEDKVQYEFDWYRSALATITERRDNTKLWWFKRWLSNFLYVKPDPRRMSALAQKEVMVPAPDLSNFADWYRHLRLESDDRALMDDLREAVDGFESMDLKDAGLGNRELKVKLASEEGQGGKSRSDFYGFDELSDGQRVLIGLYTVLHFAVKAGALICFDEPDNFVSLREVQPWLDKLFDRLEEDDSRGQVLIVSHHPELLNRMAFESGLVFERPGGRHVRVRSFDDQLKTGLSPAELITRGWDRE